MSTGNSRFYVYAHYDDLGRVFYIGKGTKNRAFKWHKGDRSIYWERHMRKYCKNKTPVVRIWATGLTEKRALIMEKEWIALYGRRAAGTGCLVNLTDGGDNPPSWHGKAHTMDTRALMAEVAKRKDLSAFLAGGKKTQFQKGQAAHNKGKPMLPHVKQALVAGRRRCTPVICLDTGIHYHSAAAAALDTCSDSSAILKVCRGKLGSTKGLRWAFANSKGDTPCPQQ